ncbi:hypothetical protein TNCV_3997411 [Trichonephila clavipes]|nr:hypothetical protein TNCV_3997411 [Trichonephila clavipes]
MRDFEVEVYSVLLTIPPTSVDAETAFSTAVYMQKFGGGDRGRVAIYQKPFGEFRRIKSYCHLYGAQGQRQAYHLPMPR